MYTGVPSVRLQNEQEEQFPDVNVHGSDDPPTTISTSYDTEWMSSMKRERLWPLTILQNNLTIENLNLTTLMEYFDERKKRQTIDENGTILPMMMTVTEDLLERPLNVDRAIREMTLWIHRNENLITIAEYRQIRRITKRMARKHPKRKNMYSTKMRNIKPRSLDEPGVISHYEPSLLPQDSMKVTMTTTKYSKNQHYNCEDCTLVEWNTTSQSYMCINSIGDWGGDCSWLENKYQNTELPVNWNMIIDLNKYLGDFSLMNSQFGRLYSFVNASWYWTSEDDPVSPHLTAERFLYSRGDRSEIGYITIQCHISRFDFEQNLQVSWFNESYTFTAINDLRMNVEGNITLNMADAIVFNYVCYNQTCARQVLALTSNVINLKDMLQNQTNTFTYEYEINRYINNDMQYCRIFHISKSDINGEMTNILVDDDIVNLNYIGAHILKLHYMTLVEIYTRELLETPEILRISDPMQRSIYDIGREVIGIREDISARPKNEIIGQYDIFHQFELQMNNPGICDKEYKDDTINREWKTQVNIKTNIEWYNPKHNEGCRSYGLGPGRFLTFIYNDGCYDKLFTNTIPITECECNRSAELWSFPKNWNYVIGDTKFDSDYRDVLIQLDINLKLLIRLEATQYYDGSNIGKMHATGEDFPNRHWWFTLNELYYYQGFIIKESYLLIEDALGLPYNINNEFVFNITWYNTFDAKDTNLYYALLKSPRPAQVEKDGKLYFSVKFDTMESNMINIIGFRYFYNLHPQFDLNALCENDYICLKNRQYHKRWQGSGQISWTSLRIGPRGAIKSDGTPNYCYDEHGWPRDNARVKQETFLVFNDPRLSREGAIRYLFNISSHDRVLCTYPKQGENDKSIERYSASEHDIYNELKLFDQRLDKVETAIDSLWDFVERLNTPEYDDSPWKFIELALSIFDIGDFIYNASKLIASTVKKSSQFLRSKIKSVTGETINSAKQWAKQIHTKSETKSLKHLTDSAAYSPLQSVEKGAVYNYVGNYKLNRIDKNEKITDVFSDYTQLFIEGTSTIKDDIVSISQLNAAAYLHLQQMSFSSLKDFRTKFNIPNTAVPFGAIFVHASPIDVIAPLGGKYLSKKFSKEVNNVFLSNSNVKYPFHTSFSSFNVEAKDKDFVLVRRYGGISEASTVGPTNIKNPKVKIGLIRFEYKMKRDGTFELNNWKDTYKFQGQSYTEEDVEQLFSSFINKYSYEKYKHLSTDDKWQYLVYVTERQYSTRDIVDGIPLANPIYISQLDRLFDYNQQYNNFNYNLLTRNCQSFVKAYIELATKGMSSKYIRDKNFEEFIRNFQKDVERYLQSPIAKGLVTKVTNFVNDLYAAVSSFSIKI